MMLFYKAWRESRARFLFSAAAIVALCLIFVLLQGEMRASRGFMPWTEKGSYSQHIYGFVYGAGHGLFLVIMAPFLGLGGLLREKVLGTSSFTLSLPVTRSRIISAQVAVGLLELGLIALIPALLVPALSPVVHETYPISQAVHFSILWFVCGALVYAMSFFFSSLLRGEYAALVACFIAVTAEDFLTGPQLSTYFNRWKIFWISDDLGNMHWDMQQHQLLSGPLPWVSLLTFTGITLILLWAGLRIAQRQEL